MFLVVKVVISLSPNYLGSIIRRRGDTIEATLLREGGRERGRKKEGREGEREGERGREGGGERERERERGGERERERESETIPGW